MIDIDEGKLVFFLGWVLSDERQIYYKKGGLSTFIPHFFLVDGHHA